MEVKDDLISRQAAIEALLEKGQSSRRYKIGEIWELNFDEIREVLNSLPSAEPEDSIPISWIEKEIDWLKNTDNCFANLTATNISAMVKRWKEEKDGRSDKETVGD